MVKMKKKDEVINFETNNIGKVMSKVSSLDQICTQPFGDVVTFYVIVFV